MAIQGISYKYDDGGSVSVKYPRQKFQQGGQVQDLNAGDQNFGTPQSNKGFFVVNPNGTTTPVVNQVAAGSGQNQLSSVGQIAGSGGGGTSVPTTAASDSGTGSGDGGATSNLTSMISSNFSDVSSVFNDVNSTKLANESMANSVFNRNAARKNLAMNETLAASNLRGAGQQQAQSGITFGEQQQQYSGGLKSAAAWSAGVAKGLTSGKT